MGEKKKLKTIQELKDSEYLSEGTDYGKVKGIPKPFLSLSGAQKCAKYYGYTHCFDIQEATENHENKFYFYRVMCRIFSESVIVGEMVGSCSTHDSGKQNAPPNTILKMAEKRAYVSAVLYVTAGSGVFSVDVEEMSPEELNSTEDGIKWFPRKPGGSNWYCGACGNKNIEEGELVAKVELNGKKQWVTKACYEHLKDVEGASTPEIEYPEDTFRKTLEQMDEGQLKEQAYMLADEKHIRIDLDEKTQDEVIALIIEWRKQ